MTTLVDTSALFVYLDSTAHDNREALRTFERLRGEDLVTHSYVVIETTALAQRRLGLDAVRELHDELLPVMSIRWVDRELHERGLRALLAMGQRQVSLVDHVSFVLMREQDIDTAFAFDSDFEDQGFATIP